MAASIAGCHLQLKEQLWLAERVFENGSPICNQKNNSHWLNRWPFQEPLERERNREIVTFVVHIWTGSDCDSAHSWWRNGAASLGDQATSTMNWYPTQSQYPDSGLRRLLVLFVVVLCHSNNISIISWRWYDVDSMRWEGESPSLHFYRLKHL